MNIMKHLAAKELHIRVGGDQNWAQSRVSIGLARAPKIFFFFYCLLLQRQWHILKLLYQSKLAVKKHLMFLCRKTKKKTQNRKYGTLNSTVHAKI